jgi:DNA-binding IclR family transcriptional regulator
MVRAGGRPIPGVNAFSVPVFDQSGSLALAITAIGPEGIFDAEWESAIAVRLRQCATEVSKGLGFSARPHAAS